MENSAIMPLARKTDLTVEDLPTEMVVYDHKRHRIHCLNRSTSFIWQRCDGRTKIEDIAAGLPEVGLPADSDIVRRALKSLNRAHLIDGEQAFPDAVLPSRRTLVRRLGLAAGTAAILLPAVRSVKAITPITARSGDSHGPHPPQPPKPPKPPHWW
jgi:hypothetical protein